MSLGSAAATSSRKYLGNKEGKELLVRTGVSLPGGLVSPHGIDRPLIRWWEEREGSSGEREIEGER